MKKGTISRLPVSNCFPIDGYGFKFFASKELIAYCDEVIATKNKKQVEKLTSSSNKMSK